MRLSLVMATVVCVAAATAVAACSDKARDVAGPSDAAAEVTELYAPVTAEFLPGATTNAQQDPGGPGGGAGCFPETLISCPYEWNIGSPPCPFDPNCQVYCPIECACCY
jgi:hypothetical protein